MPFDPVTLDRDTVFTMDPEELAESLSGYVDFPAVASLDTKKDREAAQAGLSKAVAYICYFREMEMLAGLKKRSARAEKDTVNASRLLGIEEVFSAFRRISEQQYEYILKVMTLKRLELDETKIMGDQT